MELELRLPVSPHTWVSSDLESIKEKPRKTYWSWRISAGMFTQRSLSVSSWDGNENQCLEFKVLREENWNGIFYSMMWIWKVWFMIRKPIKKEKIRKNWKINSRLHGMLEADFRMFVVLEERQSLSRPRSVNDFLIGFKSKEVNNCGPMFVVLAVSTVNYGSPRACHFFLNRHDMLDSK